MKYKYKRGADLKSEDKKIELPDVQEFLRISRTFVRQLDLLKSNNIDEKHREVIKKSVDMVSDKIRKIQFEERKNPGA